MPKINGLRVETLLDRAGNPVRVLVLDANARNFLTTVDEAVDNGRNWLGLDEDEDSAERKSEYAYAALTVGRLLGTFGPACGHGACAQHYIDTGTTTCIKGS